MKKNVAMISIILVVAFVLAAGVFGLFRADVSANNEAVIKYEEVEIEQGDTLWSIAEEYYAEPCGDIRDYIDQIRECNNLESDDIREGCYLCIPVYTKDIR